MILSDKQLVSFSLLVSVIGLIGLFLIFSLSELPSTTIQNAQSLMDDEEVRIEGRIIRSSIRGNTTFLVIEQSCTIEAVIFEPINVSVDERVSVSGTMDTYNAQREILVEELILH